MERWSYFSWVAKIQNARDLDDAMNMLGADGWELVTSVTTVKTWMNLTGNDLVFVFKKAGVGHQPTAEQLSLIAGVDPDAAY